MYDIKYLPSERSHARDLRQYGKSSSDYKTKGDQLYQFEVYVGGTNIKIKDDESAWYYERRNSGIYCATARNEQTIFSDMCCTIIKGYTPPNRTVEILTTNLPYINGCSTESLLPPIRLGDPTMQLLYMPPHSSEQEEHIHSTSRVVTVLTGSGVSISSQGEIPLKKGDVLILDKMVPHHFVTNKEHLLCSPLHVWSSVGAQEQNHPMFNGTHLT
jgi:mannose-6-phosphate isomerase-like protein (cupin superfamily)